jgi:hypothetical protein
LTAEKRKLAGPALRMAALVLPAALLAAAPMHWVEKGPVLCLFRRLADWECPGCGMTRAMAWLLRGEWQQALELNALALPLAAVLGAVVATDAVRLVRRLRHRGPRP